MTTFLPIVVRELRVAARSRTTYWMRTGVLLGALLLSAYIVNVSNQPAGALGGRLFFVLALVGMGVCLAAPLTVADSIAREVREGTLGLLFLTDLRGYDVALGKLTAAAVNQFNCLLATVPALALCVLLGGVAAPEVGRVALVLGITMLLNLCLGLLVSTWFRTAVGAMRAALGGAFGLMLLWPVLLWVWNSNAHKPPPELLQAFSPPFAFSRAFSPYYTMAPWLFWFSCGTLAAMAGVFLALTCRRLRHIWQERPESPAWGRWRGKWHRLAYGNPRTRARRRQRLLNIQPVFWLAVRSRLQTGAVMLAIFLVGSGLLLYRAQLDATQIDRAREICIVAWVLMTVGFKLWIGLVAGHQLAEARRDETLAMVFSTPLKTIEVLRGYWLALRWRFLGPALGLLAFVWLTLLTLGFGSNEWQTLAWTALAFTTIFLLDLPAIAFTAMHVGLRTQSISRILLSVALRFFLLPWLLLPFASFAVLPIFSSPQGEPEAPALVAGYLISSMIVALACLRDSHQELVRSLRLLATYPQLPSSRQMDLLLNKRRRFGPDAPA